MTNLATTELHDIFDARRVKAPELRGLDQLVNGMVGWVKNRRPVLKTLKARAAAVDALEPEIKNLGAQRFAEELRIVQEAARLGNLEGDLFIRGMALAREGAFRAVGKRPYPVQVMGAIAIIDGGISEMATGEGKTLTASLAASVLAWAGRPVHVITVNDYLVHRDAEEMGPVYRMLGTSVGHVIHETTQSERFDHYRRGVVYVTSKELVADFLRDQLALGHMRNSSQTAINLLVGGRRSPLLIPGLWRVIVDEADSLLIDEGVTPLIISNSPKDEPNAKLYQAAEHLAAQLEEGRDFRIDRTVRQVELTVHGQDFLQMLVETQEQHNSFWHGYRRREELVVQALVARHCFIRDEHYLIDSEEKVQIIDESTGRVMADRSWRHGLHQAIEVKEGVPITADKENLARLSFQRFFRQYPHMGGMTGTAWEAAGELWQIYQRPVVRIPTNKPCIRVQMPVQMFDKLTDKYEAVIRRTLELNDRGIPVLVGTRSVASSEDLARRLTATGRQFRLLNATQTAHEATIVSDAGLKGRITIATNMAGRGTDIKLASGVAELGGLHVLSTEPHVSSRVDRQLFGRAARQGDPGSAQMFASAEDDLFVKHVPQLRRAWRTIGVDRLIRIAQRRAERMSRGNRKQVLKSDDWMDQALPF